MKKNTYSRIYYFLFLAAAFFTLLHCSKGPFLTTGDPEFPTRPIELEFSIASNIDGGITIKPEPLYGSSPSSWNFIWDFGDGTAPIVERVYRNSLLFHRYYKEGTFDITLSLKIQDSIFSTITKQVSVDPFWEFVGYLPDELALPNDRKRPRLAFDDPRKGRRFFTTQNDVFVMVDDKDLAVNNQIWHMDINTGEWSKKWDAPFKIHDMEVAVLGEKAYFGFGRSGDLNLRLGIRKNLVPDFWELDLISGNWTPLPQLNQPDISYTSLCAAAGQLFAMQSNLDGAELEFWSFNPLEGRWRYEGPVGVQIEDLDPRQTEKICLPRMLSLKDKVYFFYNNNLNPYDPIVYHYETFLAEYQHEAKTWSKWQLPEGISNVLYMVALPDNTNDLVYFGGSWSYLLSGGFSFGGILGSGGSGSGPGGGEYMQYFSRYFVFNASDGSMDPFGKYPILPDFRYLTSTDPIRTESVNGSFLFRNSLYFLSFEDALYKHDL